jgi:glycosyltransferase involved in cell wall biosynthesis
MTKQTLVFIVPYLWHGGVEKVVYEVVQHLDTTLFDIHVAYFHRQDKLPIQFNPQIQLHDLSLPEDPSSPSQSSTESSEWGRLPSRIPAFIQEKIIKSRLPKLVAKTILRAIKGKLTAYQIGQIKAELAPLAEQLRVFTQQFEPETIFIPVMDTATIALWLARSEKAVHYMSWQHAYESWALKYEFADDLQKRAAKKQLLINACRAADRVIVPSEACRQDWINNFSIPAKRVQTILNPVNLSSITAQAETAPVDLSRFSDQTIFVHVARLYKEKNHKFLIRACALLKKKAENFVVICIGGGPLHDEIRQEIQSQHLENHIVLSGEKSNPYPYIAKARALLLTSVSESFGLVLVEAMACGTPVISVDCPVGPREILANGQDGVLTPLRSPKAFALAMQRMMTDQAFYDQFKERGLRRAKDYAIDKVIQKWHEVLKQAGAGS